MRPLILLLPLLVHSAILETCLRYFTNIELQKSICIECRDGYFLKNNVCMQCNRIIKNAQCTTVKAFNYGSNIVTSTPLFPSNNSTNMTVINNITSDSKTANQTNSGEKNKSISNLNNSSLKKQNDEKNITQWNQARAETNLINPLGKINLVSKIDTPTVSKLQNCKEVSAGKCSKCFLGYEIKNELCLKKRKDQNKMENCFVFSQIQSQCVMCEDGYEVSEEGYCKSPNSASQPPKISVFEDIVPNKTEFVYAKADTTTSLQKVQPSQAEYSIWLKNQNITIAGASQKNYMSESQIDIITGNSSSTFKIEKPVKLLTNSTSEANSSSNGLWREKQKQKATVRPLITLESNNDSFIIKIGQDEGCQEYDKINGKNCIKCVENYLLNPLMHKCMNINKPIDLGEVKKSPTQYNTTGETPQGKVAQTGNTIASKAQAQAQSQVQIQQSPTTTITIIVSNANANSVINISTSSAKPIVDNGNPTITTSDAKGNKVATSPSNTTNNTNLLFNTSNLSYINTTNISSNQTRLNHNATANTTANLTGNTTNNGGSGAIILSKTTTPNPHVQLPVKPNNNQTNTSTASTNSSTPNTSVKTNPTPSCTINKCVKCKQGNSECTQCEPTYQLYLGKCYDTFSYRLIVKTKMYGQTV